jgi:SAM-dependent methyltransferase
MRDALLRIFGWRELLIHGDPCVLDRWLWLRRHLLPGPVRTLDAGCGNGAFSIYAARCGNRVTAVSFSEPELSAARERARALGVEGIEFRAMDLRALAEQRVTLGSFDQIICFETIEHVIEDQALVSSLADLLAPGGRLLLTAPYDGHRPLYTEEREPEPLEDGSHVRYGYSPERVREIAQAAGLQAHSEGFVSGIVSQALTNLMRRLTERFGLMPGWLAVLPLRAAVVLDAPLSRLLRYPYLSVALCALRPTPSDVAEAARRGELTSAAR